MNTFQRIKNGIDIGLRAIRNADNIEQVSKNIDTMLANGLMTEKEATDEKSKLAVRNTSSDLAYANAYRLIRSLAAKTKDIPEYGTDARDIYISKLWRQEPILAGAVYSMTAKMTAQSWRITGRRNTALKFARVFSDAAHIGGYDWGGFISSVAQDFYTTDRGVFIETPRSGGEASPVSSFGHIDALCCTLTGNTKEPVFYSSDLTGQVLRFTPSQVMHFSSLPSTREQDVGAGFCGVSRALKAAKLLMGLHDYDMEKLSNLPPEGVAAVSGMTMDEFQDAIALWMAARRKNDSLTFPQVLWLIGSNPGSEVKLQLSAFSQLPESFDRVDVVNQYVNTLALCFGVDAREFWSISSGALGTASESEIQHLKAKGKGAGEFISITERQFNGELPEGVFFEYDTRDIEEDMIAANTAKAWIDAYLPLYTSQQGKSGPVAGPGAKPGGQALNNPTGPDNPKLSLSQGAPMVQLGKEFPNQQESNALQDAEKDSIISKKDLLRLLADKGAIPDYLVEDDRTVVMDYEIHKEGHPNDVTSFVWKDGVLKEKRLAPIILNSRNASENSNIPYADISKEDNEEIPPEKVPVVKRNIVGKPIPEDEVERGARITKTTIKDENARWRNNEKLQSHALTEEEENTYNV